VSWLSADFFYKLGQTLHCLVLWLFYWTKGVLLWFYVSKETTCFVFSQRKRKWHACILHVKQEINYYLGNHEKRRGKPRVRGLMEMWSFSFPMLRFSALSLIISAIMYYSIHAGLLGYYTFWDKTSTIKLADKMFVICHQKYITGNLLKVWIQWYIFCAIKLTLCCLN
jgi:hypothetical protein